MWFVGAGVLLLLLKLFGVPVVGEWPWWGVLSPFALAALWWTFADSAGITQRRVMDDENERARKRRDQQYENLGMRSPRAGGGRADRGADKERR